MGDEWTLEELTPNIGAVLRGVRLAQSPSASAVEVLRSALARHLVVVVPDQDLSPTELFSLAAQFGPVHHHHDDVGVLRAEGVPEVLEMRKEPDDVKLFGGTDWHADVTFTKPAGCVSFLHALVIPPAGGDTLFCSTVAAFGALSKRMQDLLRGLTGVHSYDGPTKPDHPTLTVTHPVVRTHPDTGAEGIYLNAMFVKRFDGMSEYESRPLIDFVTRHVTQPEFTCRVHWSTGHLLVWDNRFTLHYPINDFTGHHRLLIRAVALDPYATW